MKHNASADLKGGKIRVVRQLVSSGARVSKQKAPEGLRENVEVARSGGKVAGDARKAIEQQTGMPVITSKNAAQLNQVVTNLIESAESFADDDKKPEK